MVTSPQEEESAAGCIALLELLQGMLFVMHNIR